MIDWGVVVGIVGALLAALGYMGKRRADVALMDVQIELQRVKNEGSEFDQFMALINGQIQVNQTFTTALQQQAQAIEQNYRVSQQVWDRQSEEIKDNSRKARDAIIDKMDAMPQQMANIAVEGLKTVAAELAMQMADIVRQSVARLEGNVFPSLRDRRWAEAYVHPRNGLSFLFDEPRFQEPAKNLTLEAHLKGEERMWIIQEAHPGFHAVRRANGTYGFLLMSAVIVVEMGHHYPKMDTKEGDDEKQSSSDNVDSVDRTGGGDVLGSAASDGASGGGSRTTARGDKPA